MPSDTSSTPTGRRRRNILLAILAVLTVGLVYDFAVARPAVEEAYTIVTEKNVEFNIARKHKAMGVADVRELLGREPSRTFEDHEMHVEVYSWRAGLPFRTHDLFVVYRTVLGEKYVARLTKFGHDPVDGFQAVSEYPRGNGDSGELATAPGGDVPEEGDVPEQDAAAGEDDPADDAAEFASDQDQVNVGDSGGSPAGPLEADEPEPFDEE